MRRVRAWSASVLPPEVHAADTLYYPFSGPDVLYPTALFPQATRMLYTGLEPVGAAPVSGSPHHQTQKFLMLVRLKLLAGGTPSTDNLCRWFALSNMFDSAVPHPK